MERRLWLVRPNVRGVNRVASWLAEGYCAIGWREVGPVEPGISREELRRRLRRIHPTRGAGTIGAWMGNLDRFLNRMEVCDAVVTPDGPRLHVGRIRSAPWFVSDHDEAYRRRVAWEQPDAPLHRGELSQDAQAALTTMLTVADLSRIAAEVVDDPI